MKNLDGENFLNLILFDLNMPLMGGLEFLDFYNRIFFIGKENIKIVVLSSSGRQDDIKVALELGAFDYIIKPLTQEKITTVFQKLGLF